MGDFLDRIKKMGKSSEVKEDNDPRQTGVAVNGQKKCIRVELYYNGKGSLTEALGTLEVAKDVVKKMFSEFTAYDDRINPGIITPKIN